MRSAVFSEEAPVRISRSVLVLGLGLAAAACSSTAAGQRDPFSATAPAEDILLTVENNDFRDATIYILWGGVKSRAGTATGKTSRTFRSRWRSEEVQLEVDFLGRGGYVTERVPVYPGDHLNFVIMAQP
jgi:hypothetical protein